MIILEHPTDTALSILGIKKKKNGIEYKFSKYNIVLDEEIDEGVLIYNTITMACIFLTYEEYSELLDTLDAEDDLFYKSFFLVPADYDETAAIEKMKKKLEEQNKTDLQHPTSYTILPTTSCNARCFYCYEIGRPHKVMTEETAHKTATYIINHHNPNVETRLYWFGGEPTVNIRAIDIICKDLREAGVKYYSEMVSNAYLLNEENVKKGVELWNLRFVQITVDGTKDVYNKAKNYIYKDDENPYGRIMDNITTLIGYGVRIDIRLNIGTHNYEDITKLVDELLNRFGFAPNVRIYTMHIFECNMVKKRTDEEKEELFRLIDDINIRLEDGGQLTYGLDRTYKNTMCGADNGRSLLITPDGNIGLCEHHTDDEYIGHIDKVQMDWSVVKDWKTKMKRLDICDGCPLFTTCVKLKNCPEEGKCDIYERDMKVKKFYRVLQRYYENAKFAPYYLSQVNKLY